MTDSNRRRYGAAAAALIVLLLAGSAALSLQGVETPPATARATFEPPTPAPAAAGTAIDASARTAGASESWWSTVSAEIARQEYEPSPGANGTLQATNRAQNFRAHFRTTGIEVMPRGEGDPAGASRFAWQTILFGRFSRLESVGPVEPTHDGNRVSYVRPELVEWYENTPAGLEQGFTIPERPEGDGPLRLEGRLAAAEGLQAELRLGDVDFLDANGTCVFRYGGLKVVDATHASIPAQIAIDGDRLALLVEDATAVYPLTIDPLMSTPAWVVQVGENFGASLGTAGDVNGDGFSDVIVGAYLYDNGEADEGRAFIYHGSASGLSTVPAWTAESNQTQAQLGYSVGTAGDVNGDGFSDVIVGAFGYDNGEMDEGRAYVYLGSASGMSSTPSWIKESNVAGDYLGYGVGSAGDVNGDGYSDVIISEPAYTNGQVLEGRVAIYLGSPSGPTTLPSWSFESNVVNMFLGYIVNTAGDLNGDGFDDIVCIAKVSVLGNGYVFYGSATGQMIPAGEKPAWSGGSAGDVNGDGFSDLILGWRAGSAGYAGVWHGSSQGVNLAGPPNWLVSVPEQWFSERVGTAGDVNGDGYADVFVGDGGDAIFHVGAYVYQGGPAGLPATPSWTASEGGCFGFAGGTAGDVNGDGYSDLVVGDFCSGRAFTFYGAAGGLATTSSWSTESNQAAAQLGISVRSAGDVNGDGYSDVVVGADRFNGQGRAYLYAGSAAGLSTTPSWTANGNQSGAQFGFAVGTAGDVNGDGYSDVVVGAFMYDQGDPDGGRAYVYHGSSSGLSAAPAWIAGDNHAGIHYGFSVGTAGDVNGDGYSDVIVGAASFDEQDGYARVYHGSSTGLGASAAWTIGSSQFLDSFGISVGTAGDVNGDGYSDVVIGALYHDNGETNEGMAFVYQGSANGLGNVAAWTAESDQEEAQFGWSVGTAGDVNGDGFSDVIVGAVRYDNGETNEGKAFVFHGSAGGLSPNAAWAFENDQQGSFLGMSAGTAGDVNGDGYSDVIVASPWFDGLFVDGGKVWTFRGSAQGLSPAADWTAEGEANNIQLFGSSVATAGDVNGDGFSDVIVGAIGYSNPDMFHNFEGATFIYLGNEQVVTGAPLLGGNDAAPAPAQVKTDDSGPIALLGTSDSPNGFRLKVLARSPGGRSRVRLVAEVKPADVPFDGTGLAVGHAFDTGDPAQGGGSVLLSELMHGLAPETLYKWRVRVATSSPFFPGSHWFSHPGNGLTEPDLQTAVQSMAVAEPEGAPELAIPQVAPNPFAPGTGTTIAYSVLREGKVQLAIYDVQGRKVADLVNAAQDAGQYIRRWNGHGVDERPLAAGVYFLRAEIDGAAAPAQKLIISH